MGKGVNGTENVEFVPPLAVLEPKPSAISFTCRLNGMRFWNISVTLPTSARSITAHPLTRTLHLRNIDAGNMLMHSMFLAPLFRKTKASLSVEPFNQPLLPHSVAPSAGGVRRPA